MGEMVRTFEREMAAYLGAEEFIMVNSGSSANLVVVEALLRPSQGSPRLLPGSRVAVPAIAWPTTVWPVIQLGLEPHFVDIDLATLALSDETLRQSGSVESDAAVFLIHPLGRSIALDGFGGKKATESRSQILLSDVCESLGSWQGDRHAGSDGLASTFSFYFSHHITTMEGGGVATNDLELAEDIRSIRAHGWSRGRRDESKWTQDIHPTDSKFLFVTSGYNVRPMEIQAAIGLAQLEDLDSFVLRRQEIAADVNEVVAKLQNLELVGGGSGDSKANSWMLMPFRIAAGGKGHRREKALDFLAGLGVETRPVLTGNMAKQPSVRRLLDNSIEPADFPNASIADEEMFLAGCHHDFTDGQVKHLKSSLVALDHMLSE